MRVHIVSVFNVSDWILGKFVLKMCDCLNELGIECDYSNTVDETADVNHHIFYRDYKPVESKTINTVMVTHIDEVSKLNEVKAGVVTSNMHICMSNQMMHWLAQMGVDKTKLAYVDPAHDECALIKKITIGIASRVYPDGRKNEIFFNRFAKDLDHSMFIFKFMGAGWENQVDELTKEGFEVVYYNDFIREEYYKFIQSLDYYLYTGHDEGQMGFVDAAAAGVPSIVTPQGYHLDAPNALTYSFNTYEELRDILLGFQKEKLKIIKSVENWTWMDYAKKHLEIWQYLLGNDVVSTYKDGLNSHLNILNENIEKNESFEKKEKERLNSTSQHHLHQKRRNIIKKNGGFVRYIIRRIIKRLC